ncbi:F-box protein [Corchorus capsularis]|uniref:F-box protein n=1 Tax=Corchorus capsularis TaxID=210143 RepID=A0A1R3IA11_COCAP|nr:F-box protein [Corchorus capsularis]
MQLAFLQDRPLVVKTSLILFFFAVESNSCVRKSWKDLINSENFIKWHLDYSRRRNKLGILMKRYYGYGSYGHCSFSIISNNRFFSTGIDDVNHVFDNLDISSERLAHCDGLIILGILKLLEAVILEVEGVEDEGMDKGLGREEKSEGEGGEGVGGFEIERESSKWDLALRIKEWIRALGPKAKRG